MRLNTQISFYFTTTHPYPISSLNSFPGFKIPVIVQPYLNVSINNALLYGAINLISYILVPGIKSHDVPLGLTIDILISTLTRQAFSTGDDNLFNKNIKQALKSVLIEVGVRACVTDVLMLLRVPSPAVAALQFAGGVCLGT